MSADDATTVLDSVSPDESVLFPAKKKRAPAKPKVDLEPLKLFAQEIAYAEQTKVARYLSDFVDRPTFNLQEVTSALSGEDFPATAAHLYELWKINRDAGFAHEFPDKEVLEGCWGAAKSDPAWEEVMGGPANDRRYLMWLFNEQDDELRIPEGFPISLREQVITPGNAADWDRFQVILGLKKTRAKKVVEDGSVDAELKPKKAPKEPKPKKVGPARDLRSVFLKRLAELDRASLIKPWMQTKALRLVTTVAELQAWVSRTLSDQSLYKECPRTGEKMPVVAVDTENFGIKQTSGLDTRLVNGEPQLACAGLCLSSDGVEGLYVPLNHEDGNNLPLDVVREILQPLFDQSLLVFFNAKYDREVLQISCGFTLRPYPYFEDVQILHYLLDPKSEVEEEVSSFESAGLKALAHRELGIDQIELDDLTKVKARITKADGSWSDKMVLAPFHWVPTEIAVYYAAADAITTWLLWEKMREEARTMRWVHKIDHELADALAWIERQRPLIDVPTLQKTVTWHKEKMETLRQKLADMAEMGPDFNPGSTDQLSKVLFENYGFKVVKRSAKTGKPSTDVEVIEELQKQHKGHPFLEALVSFREYAALHPENLRYDVRDHTARLYFKQCTVAGGRLAAMGGKHEVDGGFGLNPQAIKSVGGNLWIPARRLRLEDLDDLGAAFDPNTVPVLEDKDLQHACFKDGKQQCPRVVNNHIARYCGEWWSLAEHETEIVTSDGHTIPLDPPAKVDANEVINLRSLFIAPPGYTFFTVDYSNIEMRVAANVSGEPKFIEEFLHGSGDFHTLTAKNVFPEFGKMQALVKELSAQDPRGEDQDIQAKITAAKGKMKKLRGLAKIINFALLYGGTEHTIYENMKATDPTITKPKAKAMVDAYWASVPKFDEWAKGMQLKAKETLKCVTASKRRIDFRSAMKAMRITPPLPEHWDNYRNYWNLKRKIEEAYTAGRKDEGDRLSKTAQELIMDKNSGVANLGDFKKFMGKIQRISVNAPLQGLAGDFMRCALGLLHQWATTAGLGDVLLVHATVHDEVDFSIKNEYVPYVLPRLVKLMKLRTVHAAMKWPVPIECDCEYGKSWDVKEHLTGDDTHSPAGYTKVPGLETYIPSMFDEDTVQALKLAVCSTDTDSREEAYAYLRANCHPRVHDNIKKLNGMNPTEAVRSLTAILQLHEYWTLEEIPENDPTDETLAAYQERMGLDPHVVRPVIIYAPEVAPADQVRVVAPEQAPDPVVPQAPPAPEEPEEDFQAPTVEATVETPTTAMRPTLRDGYPILRDLSADEAQALRQKLGVGSKTLLVHAPTGDLLRLNRVSSTEIPHEFLVLEEANG